MGLRGSKSTLRTSPVTNPKEDSDGSGAPGGPSGGYPATHKPIWAVGIMPIGDPCFASYRLGTPGRAFTPNQDARALGTHVLDDRQSRDRPLGCRHRLLLVIRLLTVNVAGPADRSGIRN